MTGPSVTEVTFEDADQLGRALAASVARSLKRAIADRGQASLVVSGGSTPLPMFRQLRQTSLDWGQVTVTLADDRCVAADDPASNQGLVRRELTTDGPAKLVGYAGPPPADLAASWSVLASIPRPFDVVILGMGGDGHFASLFPASPGLERALDPDGEAGCVAMVAPTEPRDRISLTLAALLDAGRVVLHVTGQAKHDVLDRARQPGTALELPVRALLGQRRVPVEIFWSP